MLISCFLHLCIHCVNHHISCEIIVLTLMMILEQRSDYVFCLKTVFFQSVVTPVCAVIRAMTRFLASDHPKLLVTV